MYTLNIGLNNNPLGESEIFELLKNFGLQKFVVRNGSYLNNIEPTAIAVIERIHKDQIEALCEICTQECIAIWDNHLNLGHLVYNPFFDGEKIQFDVNYFLFIGDKNTVN